MAHSTRKNRQHAGGRNEGDGGHPEDRGDALPLFESLEQRLLLSSLPVTAGTASFDLADTFLLHSNPTADKTIFLDFDGHTTTGTPWNYNYTDGDPIVTPAFTFEGDSSSFTDNEKLRIQAIWERVSEDFIPFGVDVTTEQPPLDWLMRDTSDPNDHWGQRVVIGGNNSWLGVQALGVAYPWTFGSTLDIPCFVFNSAGDEGRAECISHETGHTFGLAHDGIIDGTDYYGGHGTGETSWAPIMGGGGKSLTQWSKGEYANASNQQDDLDIITTAAGSLVGYRADDHGNDYLTASTLDLNPGAEVFDWGIIEQNTDVDFFSFTTYAGTVNLNIEAFYRGANLDILATLYDATGTPIGDPSNPIAEIDATFNLYLDAGTYYLSVDGIGKDGSYSDYASLGQYTITGALATPGINVTEAFAYEGGSVGTYDIALRTVPAGSVEITATADSQSELSLDGVNFAASQVLTFTDLTAQTVTVRAIDDASLEGYHTSTITHTITATNDATDYPTSLTLADAVVDVIDNDGATVDLILDDGETGLHSYTDTGAWTDGGTGYNGDNRYSNSGSASDVATWTFRVTPGVYDVAVTWPAGTNRATDAPFRVLDDTTQVGSIVTVDQNPAPVADYVDGGKNFEVLFTQVTITSGVLVVELSADANGFVMADAVRVLTAEADTIPPTADLASPLDGGLIEAATLNAQGYIDVTFSDVGDGLDVLTITGDELSLSGTGVGTAVLSSGAPTLVSGTTYRYAFTGSFVDGAVNVDFVAGTFTDMASNSNVLEAESFTVGPLPTVQVMDDGDTGFATVGSWTAGGAGYNGDNAYSASGTGADVATWTFTGLAAGDYEVAITWAIDPNRATNSPFRVLDDATEVASVVTINQENTPTADHVEDGKNFQIVFASVTVNSGTLVVELTDNANQYVIADAVRIEALTVVPDTTAPTADLASPANAATIEPATLNAQGYIDVTFADAGDGVDITTITGDELSISGTGVGTAVLSGTAVVVSGTTYRYAFTGSFVDGSVDVNFVAGTFADLASNVNVLESESFTVAEIVDADAPTADLADPLDSATIEPDTLNAQGYIDVTFSDVGDGLDTSTITGDELTISGAGVGTAALSGTAVQVSGSTYRYAFTGSFVDGAVNVNFVAGTFADLASNTNAAESESFTVATAPAWQVMDDGDTGFATVGNWGVGSAGYNGDNAYMDGDAADLATWTFTGLSAGDYEVAVTWAEQTNRAYNSPFRVLDDTTQVGSIVTVNQRNAPVADYVIGDRNFEILFASVTVNSGTLVVELNAGASSFVIADAVRIQQVTVGADTIAPTADLASPADASTIEPDTLNTQGYIDVTFSDVGDGLNTSTITGDELSISGTGVGTAVLDSGAPTNVSGTTYRYAFTGSFVDGAVDVSFVAGTFADLASNVNLLETESFTVEAIVDTDAPTADLANPLDSATIEPATLNAQGYIDVTFSDVGDGLDTSTITGDELSISGTGVGTAVLSSGAPTLVSGTTYRYAFTGSFVAGAVNVDFVAGTFADLASNVNAAEAESFTVAAAPAVQIIDDGDTGFATVGNWGVGAVGYEGDIAYSDDGSGADVATWTFTGLSAGDYEVAITWAESSNRATDAPFRVLDDTTQRDSAAIYQKNAPAADYVIGGKNFQIVFASVTINSGTLVVELNDDASSFVIADAVRIEALPAAFALPSGGDSTDEGSSDGDGGAQPALPAQAVGLTTSPAILGLTPAQLGTAGRSNVVLPAAAQPGPRANAFGEDGLTLEFTKAGDVSVFAGSAGLAGGGLGGRIASAFQADDLDVDLLADIVVEPLLRL